MKNKFFTIFLLVTGFIYFLGAGTAEAKIYEGIKGTGIYHKPACTVAMDTDREKVYFSSPQKAEAAGYRPCDICKPEQVFEGVKISRLYHYPWCPWAKREMTEDKEMFKTVRAAQKAGYSACDVCCPPIHQKRKINVIKEEY